MAGDWEDGRMYVLLLFITVSMRLAFIRRRSRFQQRLRLLTIRSRMRRTDAYSLQLRRKFRKRKIAWVLERPQFWFEHMVLSHYENNIWREHFRISTQTFRFVCDLVRSHLARQDTNMRKGIPVEKRVAVALWRLATGNSYRSTGLVFGVGRCTAMNLKDEFCSALLMSSRNQRKQNKKKRCREKNLYLIKFWRLRSKATRVPIYFWQWRRCCLFD